MIVRMTVTGLVALFLLSIPPVYSADREPALQSGRRPAPVHLQQPPSADSSKALRIFIENNISTAQMLKRELKVWSGRIGIPIIFVENAPYDLRIILASGSGVDSGTCSPPFAKSAAATCEVTIKLYFVSAAALTPDGKLQFTEIGVGNARRIAVTPLARKLAKRFSVMPGAKVTSAK